MGIEPTWPAWKAGTLPLSYTRKTEIHHNSHAGLVNDAGSAQCQATFSLFLIPRAESLAQKQLKTP